VSPDTQSAYDALRRALREMGRVAVAYSGGVDSSLLLRLAHDELGEGCTGLLAVSETYPRSEVASALALAEHIGARVAQIRTGELDDPSFVANDPDRCYHCKSELWTRFKAYAEEHGLGQVLDGSNADDAQDYRPGRRATAEHGIRSPLLEAGLSKDEIREISRELGLPTWSKPAMACLASRIPYGTPIQPAALARIDAAEGFIRDLGFRQVRVRCHDRIARIELDEDEIPRFLDAPVRRLVDDKLKELGFLYVTVDLRGYRTGSLNEALAEELKGPVVG
jgi:uncharacterized protein